MCGIYGFVGRPTKKTRSIIRELGLLNEERGNQSSGIAIVSKDSFKLYKQAVNSPTFWDKKQPAKFIEIDNPDNLQVIIGHTRQATQGAITDANAHPFRIGKYLFAHNGIIANFEELQWKYGTKYPVDSQIIGYLLATQGIKRTFKKLEGWFTVPFVNLENPLTLRIAKHNADLAFGIDRTGIYYTSDIKHLRAVNQLLDRNRRLIICASAENTLYTIRANDLIINKKKINPPVTTYYGGVYDDDYYDDYYGRRYYGKTSKSSDIPEMTRVEDIIGDMVESGELTKAQGEEAKEIARAKIEEDISEAIADAEAQEAKEAAKKEKHSKFNSWLPKRKDGEKMFFD